MKFIANMCEPEMPQFNFFLGVTYRSFARRSSGVACINNREQCFHPSFGDPAVGSEMGPISNRELCSIILACFAGKTRLAICKSLHFDSFPFVDYLRRLVKTGSNLSRTKAGSLGCLYSTHKSVPVCVVLCVLCVCVFVCLYVCVFVLYVCIFAYTQAMSGVMGIRASLHGMALQQRIKLTSMESLLIAIVCYHASSQYLVLRICRNQMMPDTCGHE